MTHNNSSSLEVPTNSNKENLSENDPSIKQSTDYSSPSNPKWVNNQGDEVTEVFGFNENAELVNGRIAMFGFIMLILTELVYRGEPVTKRLFGIG